VKRHHFHLSVVVVAVVGLLVLYFMPRKIDELVGESVSLPAAESPAALAPVDRGVAPPAPTWSVFPAQETAVEPTVAGQPSTVEARPPLPELDESDALVRTELAALTPDQPDPFWLNARELVRRIVMLTDNIAHGSVPRRYYPFLAPKGVFKVQEVAGKLYPDPANYERYTPLANGIRSIDNDSAATLYQWLTPLFDAAYQELGVPGSFSGSLRGALEHLLATPISDQPPELVSPKVMYSYADPVLEGLSSAQKQLLRLGPDNARAVQGKLVALAAAIGLELAEQ